MPEPVVGPDASARAWATSAALACALVVAAPSLTLPAGVDSWDNAVKIQLARNLLRGEGLALTGPTPDDPQYVLTGKDGRRYSGYLPGAALLHVLTLGVDRLTGVASEGVPTLVALALLAATLVSWGRRAGVSQGAAAAGAVLACLGTSLWPMAAYGYDVVFEALMLALVLRAAAAGDAAGGWRPWTAAGAAVGAAVATRLGAVVLAVPAVVLALVVPTRGLRPALRRALALAAGAAPGALVVLWYNFYRFGAPFVVHRPTVLGGIDDLSAPWFSALHFEGIAGLVLSPGKGILWYAPPMLLVVACAPALARRHRAALLAIGAYAAAALLMFGRFRFWHGDWSWGPRYLAPLFVACAPLAWLVFERSAGSTSRSRLALAGLVLAATLQAAPLLVHPLGIHRRLVVDPLVAEGRLATKPVDRPPVPEDYGVLYFTPRHSMIVSLARGIGRAGFAPDPWDRVEFWARAIRALAVPLAAAFFVVSMVRRRPVGTGSSRVSETPEVHA